MKYYYILLLSIIIFSCKSQNQPLENDTTNADTAISEEEPDSSVKARIVYCADLAKEILKSSPRYKQLTKGLTAAVKKNGGNSVDVFLDKSPDPKKDNSLEYSANYEMQLTENYPDRKVNIAHFTFNPKNNQLYEYDVVRDQLITIEFDQNLIYNSNQFCK